VETVKLYQTP